MAKKYKCPCVMKASGNCGKRKKTKTTVATHKTHRKSIPKECHGLNKYEVKNCVKTACAKKPTEVAQKACLRRAKIKVAKTLKLGFPY